MLQQENPTLRGKPIGIVKGVGRTCIIASSNEAKRVGVETGSGVKDAKQKAPKIILVPANFDIMLSATRKLKALFETFSPDIDVFSLDEVFLNLTGCETLMRTKTGSSEVVAYGRSIQQRIREVLGEWVQCNVGISHNKLLAKMAGEIPPKGGIFHITPQNLDSILSSVTLKEVCGVGFRLAEKLAALGVSTPYQINLLDDETLQSHFGPFWAIELRKVGRGEETHFFHTRKGGFLYQNLDYQKSVGRTITGYTLCNNDEQIKRILLNLLEEATHKLRAMDSVGRKIGISLWGHDTHWGQSIILKYWVRHTDEIWDLITTHLYSKWYTKFPVIKFGVWIGECKPMREVPGCLLHTWKKRERLYSAIDQVNSRFGTFTLKPATLLGGELIKPEVTGYLGDKVYLGLN